MEFLKSTLELNDFKILIMNFISERLGTFDITISSSINKEDAKIGKEEFFDYEKSYVVYKANACRKGHLKFQLLFFL